MPFIDLALRIQELVASVRATYLATADGLPPSAHETLARAAILELSALAKVEPPVARMRVLRPVIVPTGAVPICEPVEPAPRPSEPAVHIASEARIAEVLAAPARFGETIEAGFRRKECELGELFAALSPIEARALQRRLANPSAGDQLATTFARLALDRRNRLLAFLADARRRAARLGVA